MQGGRRERELPQGADPPRGVGYLPGLPPPPPSGGGGKLGEALRGGLHGEGGALRTRPAQRDATRCTPAGAAGRGPRTATTDGAVRARAMGSSPARAKTPARGLREP